MGKENKALLLMRSPGSQVNQSPSFLDFFLLFLFYCAGKAQRRVSERTCCSVISIIHLYPALLLIVFSIDKPAAVISQLGWLKRRSSDLSRHFDSTSGRFHRNLLAVEI